MSLDFFTKKHNAAAIERVSQDTLTRNAHFTNMDSNKAFDMKPVAHGIPKHLEHTAQKALTSHGHGIGS